MREKRDVGEKSQQARGKRQEVKIRRKDKKVFTNINGLYCFLFLWKTNFRNDNFTINSCM
jgi:hypothetical protein